MFDLGDVWNLTFDSKNEAGALADAQTVALTITVYGDAITGLPAVVNPPATTGKYRYSYTPTVPGRHAARWLLTYADGRSEAHTETLDVRPADPGGIVSLTVAKAHLNMRRNENDDELRGWIGAVTEVIENRVGPCLVREYTATVRGGGSSWWLPRYPVLELVSASAVGGSGNLQVSDLRLIGETGQVVSANGRCVPGGMWTVVYLAGREVIPANIVQACLIVLKHLWETQRGGSGRERIALGGEDDTYQPGFPWAIPRRAVELLEPHMLGPLVA